MSGFALEAEAFLVALRKNPSLAQDAVLVENMIRRAHGAMARAHVAMAAPLAPETWEAQGVLDAATETSAEVGLEFPVPIVVLGFVCTTALQADPGANVFVIPGLSDVLVQVVSNRKEQLVTGQQQTTAGDSSNFVSMASLNLNAHRLVGKCIDTPNPKLFFTWRWRAGANVWPGVFPSVAVVWKPLRAPDLEG